MSISTILAGPIIGSLIGYMTNYIAVKMLFRPYYPIKISNFTLPFTPGIFPKRKEELAKALGKTVSDNLLTGADIEEMFLAEEVKEKVIDEIRALLDSENGATIKSMIITRLGQDDYQRGKAKLEQLLSEKIVSGISKSNLGEIIIRESVRTIKEKTNGSMLAFIANDKLIASMVTPIGEKIESYLEENGLELIRPFVSKELENLENKTLKDLATEINLEKDHLLEMADKVYTGLIRTKVTVFIKHFDIAGVVEQKINAMDVAEIERLVLSIMKRELNAVVNLGALIGLIIGTLNIFI